MIGLAFAPAHELGGVKPMTLVEMLGIDLPIIQARWSECLLPRWPPLRPLNAAAKAAHDSGYGAQWAGQGAPLARALPAAELVAVLAQELRQATKTGVE